MNKIKDTYPVRYLRLMKDYFSANPSELIHSIATGVLGANIILSPFYGMQESSIRYVNYVTLAILIGLSPEDCITEYELRKEHKLKIPKYLRKAAENQQCKSGILPIV